MKNTILFPLGFLFITSLYVSINAQTSPDQKPLNIILMIGDGMGLTQMSSIYYFGKGNEPNFSRFPYIGLINTSSAKQKITDSAAGATAFSAGIKTYNGAIGVGVDSLPKETILESLTGQGYSTAVIATSSITHATPAAFYAHTFSRAQQDEIAAQLTRSSVDFFAGGGWQFFCQREDSTNYLDSLEAYNFVVDTAQLQTREWEKSKKYGYLLAADGMPPMTEGRGPFLKDATLLALECMQAKEKPFFMMVEGSQIDWGGHANDAKYIVTEVQDFDEAIGAALDFAEKDGNTIVVVTSDHETGGFALSAFELRMQAIYENIVPTFSTGGHTATLIPVYAYGPGAEKFAGIYQNNEIYDKLKQLSTIEK